MLIDDRLTNVKLLVRSGENSWKEYLQIFDRTKLSLYLIPQTIPFELHFINSQNIHSPTYCKSTISDRKKSYITFVPRVRPVQFPRGYRKTLPPSIFLAFLFPRNETTFFVPEDDQPLFTASRRSAKQCFAARKEISRAANCPRTPRYFLIHPCFLETNLVPPRGLSIRKLATPREE